MANNFVVKLGGDSKGYQTAVEQARKSLEGFQKQNISTKAVMREVTNTLTKYVSVAALVKGAQEALNRVIQGSQTTADAWAGAMAAAKTTVDNFFSSLSTGDFTSFNQGLRSMTQNAYAAQQALDALDNASMSWSYFQSARRADLTDLREIVNDESAPKAERQAALEQMRAIQAELRSKAAGYEQRAMEAMAREMSKATLLDWQSVSRSDLERVLALDLLNINSSNAEKARLEAEYAEYQAKAEKNRQDNSTYQSPVMTANGVTIPGGYYQTDEQKKRIAEETRALAAGYQEAILYNQVLVRGTDDWLRALIAIVQQADAAAASMRSVDRQIDSAERAVNKVTPSGAGPGSSPDKAEVAAFWNSGGFLEAALAPRKLYDGPFKDVDVPDAELERLFRSMNDVGAADSLADLASQTESLASQTPKIASAADAWAQLGAAMSGVGSDALGAAGSIISAVAAAVPAFQTLTAHASMAAGAEAVAETPSIIGKIAAAASITATLITMISNLKNLGSYAEGGIIGGSNFTDGITARVSSGEMVINEADQKRLYDSIHSGSFGAGGGNSIVTGEQIVSVINNYGRRTGRGEILR